MFTFFNAYVTFMLTVRRLTQFYYGLYQLTFVVYPSVVKERHLVQLSIYILNFVKKDFVSNYWNTITPKAAMSALIS